MPDLTKQKWRSKLEAWLLDLGADGSHAAWSDRKSSIIGSMHGTVVELGPGTGVNMRYYAPGVRLIAIEPNPVMHPKLRDAAETHGVDLEIRQLDGASIDVGDRAADGVVGTLLLCGGPFADVEIEAVDRGRSALWVRHQIGGVAHKSPVQ